VIVPAGEEGKVVLLVAFWVLQLSFSLICKIRYPYFYSQTNQMHIISNLFYFGTKLYIPINKSTNQMHQSLRFIARLLNTAQHVSDRPRTTALLPPRSNGKPEAATAVYKLLMMRMKMPETC